MIPSVKILVSRCEEVLKEPDPDMSLLVGAALNIKLYLIDLEAKAIRTKDEELLKEIRETRKEIKLLNIPYISADIKDKEDGMEL